MIIMIGEFGYHGSESCYVIGTDNAFDSAVDIICSIVGDDKKKLFHSVVL